MSTKPYWEMSKEELAEATREFDEELPIDPFHPLEPEKREIWERLRSSGEKKRPETP